ncbi:hypothetical protein R1sor_013930 [Riccia sorocarpa]|uniref:Uncharacterized protein n=1 Tax=Riccia sorocarpa TaxID=122646 RepID=A0ABD3H9U0_9MARC
MRLQNEEAGDLKERVVNLEKELRSKELADARCWRMRSRIRWMALGEAPSHYYFAQLKAKHTREAIQSLRTEDGRETRSEKEIRKEVTEYFEAQFRCRKATEDELLLRGEVLKLVDRKVSAEQNHELISRPSENEVDELAADLPRDKAPGLDGVTNNMIQDCWLFIREDCQSWYKARKHMFFNELGAELPHDLAFWKLELLTKKSSTPPQVMWTKVRALFRKCELFAIEDLLHTTGQRKILPGLDRELRTDSVTATSLLALKNWIRQTKLSTSRCREETSESLRGKGGTF